MLRQRDALKILVVEDNPGDAALFQTFFKQEQNRCDFYLASDGEEALDFLHHRLVADKTLRPDIIVVDLNLPKIDGKAVVRDIKNDPDLRTIPVIVMTSSENEEDIRQSYEVGANCVLRKAVDVDEATRIFELLESFWVNTVRLAKAK